MGPPTHSARDLSPCSPPDIVISSSPTFSRRTNFKLAARKRSQEKVRLKKLQMLGVKGEEEAHYAGARHDTASQTRRSSQVPVSLPLERRGEASQFWTAAASVGSPSPSDSARELLLAKRISLTHHAPDIVQLAVQQQHEFIKVGRQLSVILIHGAY